MPRPAVDGLNYNFMNFKIYWNSTSVSRIGKFLRI